MKHIKVYTAESVWRKQMDKTQQVRVGRLAVVCCSAVCSVLCVARTPTLPPPLPHLPSLRLCKS